MGARKQPLPGSSAAVVADILVGDWVRLRNGAVRQVVSIKMSNHLRRFTLSGKPPIVCGRTKIVAKLPHAEQLAPNDAK